MTIKVGNHEKKEVSELNHTLYKKAEEILDSETYNAYHIGWYGVGLFIDWLESNYELTKKEV